jgi:hypothetical protein
MVHDSWWNQTFYKTPPPLHSILHYLPLFVYRSNIQFFEFPLPFDLSHSSSSSSSFLTSSHFKLIPTWLESHLIGIGMGEGWGWMIPMQLQFAEIRIHISYVYCILIYTYICTYVYMEQEEYIVHMIWGVSTEHVWEEISLTQAQTQTQPLHSNSENELRRRRRGEK